MRGAAHGRRRAARTIPPPSEDSPYVSVVAGRDHVHLDPPLAHALDEPGHEPPREVVGAARVGRREDGDLHAPGCAGADGRTLLQRRMNAPGTHVAIETA